MGIRQCPNDSVPEVVHFLLIWTEGVISVSGIALVCRFSPSLSCEILLWGLLSQGVSWLCWDLWLLCLAPWQDLSWWVVPLIGLLPLPPPGELRCFSESKSILTFYLGEPGAPVCRNLELMTIRDMCQSSCFYLCFRVTLRRSIGELALNFLCSLPVGFPGLW